MSIVTSLDSIKLSKPKFQFAYSTIINLERIRFQEAMDLILIFYHIALFKKFINILYKM